MPIDLINATKDLRGRDDPKAIDQETWRTRIEARTKYALAAKGKPGTDGKQRYHRSTPSVLSQALQPPHRPQAPAGRSSAQSSRPAKDLRTDRHHHDHQGRRQALAAAGLWQP